MLAGGFAAGAFGSWTVVGPGAGEGGGTPGPTDWRWRGRRPEVSVIHDDVRALCEILHGLTGHLGLHPFVDLRSNGRQSPACRASRH